MPFTKARKILDTAKQLVSKLEDDKSNLDELQKAQVVQTLVKSKVTIVKELQIVHFTSHQKDEHTSLFKEVKNLEAKIQEHAQKIDLPKVQVALDHLSEGVNELLRRKKSGEKIVKE